MALFLNLSKLSPSATKALLEQGVSKRAAELAAQTEANGGRLLGYYLADGGEWDVVGLFDLPEDMDASTRASLVLHIQASGQHERFRSIPLLTPESVDAAVPPAMRPLLHD